MQVEDAITLVLLTAHFEDVRITVHMYFSSANNTTNEPPNPKPMHRLRLSFKFGEAYFHHKTAPL